MTRPSRNELVYRVYEVAKKGLNSITPRTAPGYAGLRSDLKKTLDVLLDIETAVSEVEQHDDWVKALPIEDMARDIEARFPNAACIWGDAMEHPIVNPDADDQIQVAVFGIEASDWDEWFLFAGELTKKYGDDARDAVDLFTIPMEVAEKYNQKDLQAAREGRERRKRKES